MREVKIKEWIPIRRKLENGKPIGIRIKGTGCYSEEYTKTGQFHEWGVESEAYEDSVSNDSMAIIEFPDGTIEMIRPCTIQFQDKLNLNL